MEHSSKGKSSISTHAPLAGRDRKSHSISYVPPVFQPTRPLRGATVKSGIHVSIAHAFQPTRPLRGATACAQRSQSQMSISTHAPLAGRDFFFWVSLKAALISTHAPLARRDCKSVQITMHIFAITDKFQMLLHRMPTVRAFCSFLMQENHADFGCEPPK